MTTPPPAGPTSFTGSDAHELSAGPEARVAAELQALPTVHMPADVAERLTATFQATPGRQAPHLASLRSARHRRRRELVMAAAASLVCVALAALIFMQWFGDKEPSSSTNAGKPQKGASATNSVEQSAEDSAAAAPNPQAENAMPDNRSVSASGTDYQRMSIPDQMQAASTTGGVSMPEAAARVPELAPLTQFDRLEACMEELSARGRLLGMDYAFFEGKPALVLLVSSPQDEQKRIVLIVGPACDTGIPDYRYSTTITATR